MRSKFDSVRPIINSDGKMVGVVVTPARDVLSRLLVYADNKDESLTFRVDCLRSYIFIKIGVIKEKHCKQ